ncbi:MAG: ArnT family glycosyltransferase [Chthoniobacterales bacterium]
MKRSRIHFAALSGWCVVLFVAAMFFYTRDNHLPVELHADEVPKAAQFLDGHLSYRQPLLLVTATDLVMRLSRQVPAVQEMVLTGRVVSAAFAAGTVVLLSLLAYTSYRSDLRAATVVGAAVLACPQLLLLAHYFKEDTALVFTAAAYLLAVWFYDCRPGQGGAVLLGVTAALAVSAKYVGFVAVPVTYWLLRARPAPEKDARSLRAFTIALVFCWLAINYRVLLHPWRFLVGIGFEVGHPLAGHRGLIDGILLSSPLWEMLAANISPLIVVLAAIYFIVALHSYRQLPRATFLLVYGAPVYLFLLSLSRFLLDRHLLPLTVAIYVMAGLAVVELTRFLRTPAARSAATLVMFVALVGTAIPLDRAIFHELENETRVQLRAWIRDNLPPGAVIAQDRPAHLDASGFGLHFAPVIAQKLLTPSDFFVTDLGSIAELRAKGVTHVVTCDEAYGRLFTRHPVNTTVRESYRRRRAGYEEIFSSGTLLFEAKPARAVGGGLSPIVRVYAVSPARVAGVNSSPIVGSSVCDSETDEKMFVFNCELSSISR